MIVITGANGQLGKALKQLIPENKAIFYSSRELDVVNFINCNESIISVKPSIIINCAAYTNVEKAEIEIDQALKVNARGVENLVFIANKYQIPLIHISTDYVFDGLKNSPYLESDIPMPVNSYGKSKYAGEKIMINNCHKGVIIRTSWLYSAGQNNFLSKVLTMLKEKDNLKIVFDQVGTPTFALDLARFIIKITQKYTFEKTEIIHYSNQGTASWFDFACAISRISGMKKPIEPVFTTEFATLVKRPHYSVLAKTKAINIEPNIPHWYDSLEKCIKNYFLD